MMALRVLALVVLTGLVIGDELPVEDWGVEGAEFRLLLESSAESGERSAVELASLGAAIGLTNVVDVVDLTDGESVAWALTSDRGWLTFEEGDGGELGVYLSTNASLGALSSGSLVVSGKLERVTSAAWLRNSNSRERQEWFAGRVSRLAGAAAEREGTQSVSRVLADLDQTLRELCGRSVAMSPPYERERKLYMQEGAFEPLLASLVASEMGSLAAEFSTLESTLAKAKSRGAGPARLAIRPWHVARGRGGVGRLSGELRVERQGTALFGAYSVFGGLLRIDGATVAVVPMRTSIEPEGWLSSARVELSAGSHWVEFVAQGRQTDMMAGVTWVAPGETTERHLVDSDFAPGKPARVVRLEKRNGSVQGLVRVLRRGRTGVLSTTRLWADVESLSGDAVWQANGLTRRGEQIKLCLGGGASVFEVETAGQCFGVMLEESRFARLDGDVGVRVELPAYMYGDEALSGCVQLISEAETGLEVDVEGSFASGDHRALLLEQRVEIPGCGARMMYPLAPAGRRELGLSLTGDAIPPGGVFRFSVTRFPEVLSTIDILVRAPSACVGVRVDELGHMVTEDGTRVLVKLSRPTLGDRRRWSLLSGIRNRARRVRRLMVVVDVDEWGGEPFERALAAAAELEGVDMTVLPWRRAFAGGGSVRASLGDVVETLAGGDADSVLIVPPLSDVATGVSPRELSRALAAVVEASSDRVGRERVWLSTLPVGPGTEAVAVDVGDAIERVASDYGVGLVPLMKWQRNVLNAGDGVEPSHGEEMLVPVGMSGRVARYLLNWVNGGNT